jgi:hypothetical protein
LRHQRHRQPRERSSGNLRHDKPPTTSNELANQLTNNQPTTNFSNQLFPTALSKTKSTFSNNFSLTKPKTKKPKKIK